MKLKKKKLTPTKRICLRLKEARESCHVSIDQIAKRIRISSHHLENLEACRFDDLPFAPVYQKNMIKRYIEALGMDPKTFINQFVFEQGETKNESAPQKTVDRHLSRFRNFPLVLRTLAIIAILIGFGGYLSLQIKHILEPPALVIYSPDNGQVAHHVALTIQGKTDKEARVQINGNTIINNEQGFFQETITLNPGMNTITLSAQKKHGKTTMETRHVIYKENDLLSSNRNVPSL